MKKLLYTVVALLFVVFSTNANPRLKNKKHFKKDFDPNKKVEAPLTTLAELNKGPLYKNQGHDRAAEGKVVNVDNANTLKGPKYKNQKHTKATPVITDDRPEIAEVE